MRLLVSEAVLWEHGRVCEPGMVLLRTYTHTCIHTHTHATFAAEEEQERHMEKRWQNRPIYVAKETYPNATLAAEEEG